MPAAADDADFAMPREHTRGAMALRGEDARLSARHAQRGAKDACLCYCLSMMITARYARYGVER